jgi:hypothetical protein
MNRNFNPQIRQLTRLALQLPPETPLPDCSWPTRAEECDLNKRNNLIESSNISTLVERFEIRSPVERNECAIGPEFYNILKNTKDLRTVSEALADIETQAGTIPKEARKEFIHKVEGIVKEDMQRRTNVILLYVGYFTLSLIFLSYQIQKASSLVTISGLNNYILTIALTVIPLIVSFVLHTRFAERVRNSTLIHLLPILLLVSIVAYNQCLEAGSADTLNKTILVGAIGGALLVGGYLIMSFRGVFRDCAIRQRNVNFDPTTVTGFGLVGIILPIVLLLVGYSTV